MKATELMIGDWVALSHPDYQSPLQVTQIMTLNGGVYHAILHSEKYEKDIVVGLMDVEPIPLTEDILGANGFVDGVLRYVLCHSKLTMSIERCNDVWFFDIEEEAKLCDVVLSSAHELQHAFRLYGLNELADNFKLK